MPSKQKSDRRQFLKSVAGVAVGVMGMPAVIPSSALGLDGSTAPSNRIVAAAIGVGMMGTGDLQSYMKGFDEMQFVAVCDVDKARLSVNNVTYGWEPAKKIVESYYAQKKPSGAYKGCAVYVDYRELLEKNHNLSAKEIRYQATVRPIKLFWKLYVKKHGHREGRVGLIFCALYSFVHFLKWAKAWELKEPA